ncbi:universal stress protein [Halomicroarcula sp. GCM10025324]|uniref:universal stress protein n=1 Tax=Haloarcula TaxID=2237 RepID=UPI0036234C01
MMRVLVPLAILDGETVSPGLMDLLGTMDVTVLGYQLLPEQTPPDQARAQFEERATSALEDVTAEFREAGGDADHRLVFTGDRRQSIDRVATDVGARAYAINGATGTVERLLVPLSGDVAVERILEFVAALVGERAIGVTLLVVGEEDPAEPRLSDAADQLAAMGVDVATRRGTGNPLDALVDAVAGHDAVVMGQRAPSLASLVWGGAEDRVAAASVGPVLVVRREDADTAPD